MAGSGGFSISISAVDKTAGALDGINKRLARLSAPAERFNKALSKFGDTSGISRVTEGVRSLGAGAADTFRSLDRMASPLAAITSVGSIAGIVELSRRWAEFGTRVGQVAYRLDAPVEKLGALRGAARLAGVGAADLDTGLGSLDEKLRGAAFGRDSGAVQLFKSLHIGFGDAKNGARTATDALGDVAEAIHNAKDPRDQQYIADQLGLGSLLPLLKNGRKGLEDFQKQAEQTGGVMTGQMVKNATEMNKAWQRFGLDFEGVGNRIVDSWSGTVTKVLENSSKWIEDNKKTADSVTQIGSAVGVLAALKPAAWVLRLLGLGAIPAAASAAAPLAAPLALSGDTPNTPYQGTPEEKAALDAYSASHPKVGVLRWLWRHTFGGSDPGDTGPAPPIADVTMTPTKRAFLSTLAQPESRGRYDIKNGGSRFSDFSKFPEGIGPGGSSTAAGRYQFISGTWADEQRRLGLKDFSPENQDKAGWDLAWSTYKTKTGRDLEDDLKAGGHNSDVATALREVWPSLPGGSQSGESQPQFDQLMSRNLASESGHVQVDVHIKGAPPGTTGRTTTTGPVTSPPPRIESPMPLVN